MRKIGRGLWLAVFAELCVLGGCAGQSPFGVFVGSTKELCGDASAGRYSKGGEDQRRTILREGADTTARCLGGKKAASLREGPWLDWPNYWAAGDATSRAPARLLANAKVVGPNAHGINGALYELELQRIELISSISSTTTRPTRPTSQAETARQAGAPIPGLKCDYPRAIPTSHLSGGNQAQVCRGALIRFRTLDGLCNDIRIR